MKIVKPFHEGLARDELLIPWCKRCGKPHFYPRSACPHCWAEEYEWRPAAGGGAVHTFTTVRANPPSTFSAALPYCIAIIDLDEGVRLLSNVLDHPTLAISDRVMLEFVSRGDARLPVFRRVA